MEVIRELFASDISRRIEEVIKVDQDDEAIVHEELAEYVVTDSIKAHMLEILERYYESPNKPHEGIGIWVSGFFGSGKSSFAKYLGLALENRPILGQGAGALLGERTGDQKAQLLLMNIAERIPTTAVIFDISTDRGIRSGNQSVTEIMYRLLLQGLGYARDLDLSELEITLEEEGQLDSFKAIYGQLYERDWDSEKGKFAIAVQQASRVMHEMDPATYPTVDSWRESAMGRADITAGKLAERGLKLMAKRRPDHTLIFVVDEVGQFVARDVQKMLDLQAVVQSLGRVGRGRMWLMVTSQERLTELVGGLDDNRVELARLMDRFPLQVHLEPSDILEVTSRRVLAKNAVAEQVLRDLYEMHRGRLAGHTHITAGITLPELTTQSFLLLYPLLPYQIDLIIQVVSGLRTQGGASKHVGGANRTIIKLAQQLLIHPDVDLQNAPLGTLVRIDQIYDLVAGNIASEVRGKIADIGRQVDHPYAQRVAKAICLLQHVQSIPSTAENLAAMLHPSLTADSCLTQVQGALTALEEAHMVRYGKDGYRIPTPAEDDWERQRGGLLPKPVDLNRIYQDVVRNLWRPQPSHTLGNVKSFKAGLVINGRHLEEGEVPFYVTLAEANDYMESVEEARQRSQAEGQAVFWVASLDETIDQQAVEVYRSVEIMARRERGARTKDETALVADEKRRLGRHQDELSRLIKQALLNGSVFFRGNDRSPAGANGDLSQAASRVLAQALPEVFHRFSEAGFRVGDKDLESVMTTENLRGLTPVFSELGLLRDQSGKPVFITESGPLAEVLACIQNRTSYSDVANGRYLTDEFSKEPYGWDFDVVRLFVVALLRADKIEATSQGRLIDSALSLEAKNAFTNNNRFRQASFSPKKSLDFLQLVDAAEHFRKTFGIEIPALELAPVAGAIREQVQAKADGLREMHTTLIKYDLPGADVLRSAMEQVDFLSSASDERAVLTFNAAHNELKEASLRVTDLAHVLTETAIGDLQEAQGTLKETWVFLKDEEDLGEAWSERAAALADLLQRETFFRELPAISGHTRALRAEYERRYDLADQARRQVYGEAVEQLAAMPEWNQLNEEQQQKVADPLRLRAGVAKASRESIPLLRADVDACPARLKRATEETLQLVEGNRVVRLHVGRYFGASVETAEQLDEALEALKQECLQLLAEGKRILLQ